MTNGNTKRINAWINPSTYKELSQFLQDDSNRILGAKIKQGGAVDLGLQLLFIARQTDSLDKIYQDCINAGVTDGNI